MTTTISLAPKELEMQETTIDTYHGVRVSDPFRWLEDHHSLRTRTWIDEQATMSRQYLDDLAGRDKLRKRVQELVDQESFGDINIAGEQVFYTRRRPGEQQAKLYRREGLYAREQLVLDPESLGEGDSLSLTILDVSPDGRLLACGLRSGGQGARRVRILDLATGDMLPDELPKGAIRGFALLSENNGFFYVTEEVGKPGNPKAAKTHYFGQSPDRDKTVFYAGRACNIRLVSGFERKSCTATHTVVRAVNGQNLETIHLQMLCRCGKPLMTLVEDTPASWDIQIADDQLYILFDHQDGTGRKLLRVPLEEPDLNRAETILIEGPTRIQTWRVLGERILTSTVENLSSVLRLCNLKGEAIGVIDLPGIGTANVLAANAAGCFFSFESYTHPREIYHYDFSVQKRTLFSSPTDELHHVVVRRLQYSGPDGTQIPLTVVGKQETFDRASAPVLLTAYGAAGVSLTPQYSPLATYFVELGGLFAIAHIRGGGEYGRAWEEAGKRHHRPTVHKDFIAAVEFLIASGMADRNRIAIAGGSNSGLLVGTAMTQRPDLFQAVLCVAPIIDMLRYHRFDNTQFYLPQFGSADNPDDFPILLSYSPYHNVHDGVRYPALLMVSGDADTRCDPMHARKFVARLQAATNVLPEADRQSRPILLDWNPLRGHFATLSLEVRKQAIIDRLAFLCHHLQMEVA